MPPTTTPASTMIVSWSAYVGVTVRSTNTFGDPPARSVSTIDATLLPNGEYWLRLQAVNSTGAAQVRAGTWGLLGLVGSYAPVTGQGIGVAGFIRCDHGYWGAQLIEPYVDEEVSWAVRVHQALRFFPDESVGYKYPDMYLKYFGPDYKPEPYIVEEYKRARGHKYYMTARLICVNDIYSFDPNAKVDLDDFVDIIGRNFKQPKEGLGFDNTPASHMWRTLMWPTRFL